MGVFIYEDEFYQRYTREVVFISAEWGKQLKLPISEDSFKKALHRNYQRQGAGAHSCLYLKDIFNDFT